MQFSAAKKEKILEQIRELKAQGQTHVQIGKAVGLADVTVSRWLRGWKQPQIKTYDATPVRKTCTYKNKIAVGGSQQRLAVVLGTPAQIQEFLRGL